MMELIELEELLQRPEVLHQILGDYRGPYAMGVTRSENANEGYEVFVRVPDEDATQIKTSIILGDKIIPILVKGGYRQPQFPYSMATT